MFKDMQVIGESNKRYVARTHKPSKTIDSLVKYRETVREKAVEISLMARTIPFISIKPRI